MSLRRASSSTVPNVRDLSKLYLWLLLPSIGGLENPATLSAGRDQASGFAEGA